MAGGALLDLDRLASAKAETEFFPFVAVAQFLRPEAVEGVQADFPNLVEPRNHKVGSVPHGPVFQQLLDELASPELARLLGRVLGEEGLEELPQNVTVRALSEGSDGNVHRDHWSKCVSMLVYPNERWEAEGGRLRLLRSKKLDDYASEVTPDFGTMVAFRRTRNSWHGYKPYVGVRRALQVNWLRSSPLAAVSHGLSRRITHARKRLGLHPDH